MDAGIGMGDKIPRRMNLMKTKMPWAGVLVSLKDNLVKQTEAQGRSIAVPRRRDGRRRLHFHEE